MDSGGVEDFSYNANVLTTTGLKISQVAPDTLVLCDGGWGSEYTPGGSPSFNEYIEQWVPSWRHTLGANFLFMDGHAEWWSKAFLANGTTGNKYCTIAKD